MKQFGSIVGRSGFGVVNTIPDSDNFIRKFKLNYESTTGKKFALAGFANRISAYYMKHDTLSGSEVKTINYELNREMPIVPFHEVIEAIDKKDDAFLNKWFNNKIVLMGVTNVSGDILPTPIAQETLRILIHAHAIDMLIHDNELTKTPDYIYFITSILIAFIVVFYSSKLGLATSSSLTLAIFLLFSSTNLFLFLPYLMRQRKSARYFLPFQL